MPSSLNQTLDKELAARGGATRGLGLFLRQAYGESDLRGELTQRLAAATQSASWEAANQILQVDASAGGVLPKRSLSDYVGHSELAAWLVRAVSCRSDGDALLASMAGRSSACPSLAGLVARRGLVKDRSAGTLSADEVIAFGASLQEVLVPARKTERAVPRAERKVGRNDPCPCGSGKKFKKCHASDPKFLESLEATDLDDAPGLPGISASEVFWFREASDDALGALCKARLEQGGPRAGETLFWPDEEAPLDELAVRLQIAAADGHGRLAGLISRGLESGVLTSEFVRDQVMVAFPVQDWSQEPPVELYRSLSRVAAQRLEVGHWVTAEDVIALADDPELRRKRLREALAKVGSGSIDLAADVAVALAQAGAGTAAFLLIHFCRASGLASTLVQGRALQQLDSALAADHGNAPLHEADWLRRDERVEEIARLRAEAREAKAALEEAKSGLNRSENLRKRAEEVWNARVSVPGEALEAGGTVRREVKRLKGLLTQEHDRRRDVERNLETMKRRERARLLRESGVAAMQEGADESAAEAEPAENEADAQASRARRVSYHPDFETVAQRLPPSTVERLRTNIDSLAAGRWVREAKRMEGIANLWTLRAGIHYRALIREVDDTLVVYALIPREELDSTLARLRS